LPNLPGHGCKLPQYLFSIYNAARSILVMNIFQLRSCTKEILDFKHLNLWSVACQSWWYLVLIILYVLV